MLPNLIDDMNLDPYAFRLYVHLRRVAGEKGACWQSTDTLAETCNMSAGAVSNAKKELAERGLITIEQRAKNGTHYHHITITDIWKQNFAAFSPDESTLSPDETKKNHVKKFQPSAGEKSTRQTGGELPKEKDSPTNFEEWIDIAEKASNKQAVVANMVVSLFPKQYPSGVPKGFYGRVAKTAKRPGIGSYSRLMQLLWQASSFRPTGDVLSYCIGLAKGNAPKEQHQESRHPGDSISYRDGKPVVRLGQ